ncbi:DoxX family protein [Paraburkholderia sp. EG287B]|uniref:DoxX family protein n=1 Tax=Paraburkholderia sp. EG287B TaxID=3237010 RepID=UPI0034D1CEB4
MFRKSCFNKAELFNHEEMVACCLDRRYRHLTIARVSLVDLSSTSTRVTASITPAATTMMGDGWLPPSIAAFVASGEMAFAYFVAHAPQGFWTVLNLGEPAVLFCFDLAITFAGSGVWTFDVVLHPSSEPALITSNT